MSERLTAAALSPDAAAVRANRRRGIVHLGLGAFHRSHEAWFTQRVPADREQWGIVAFTGRKPDAAQELAAQGAVYTLLERSADDDTATLVDVILEAHDGADAAAWRAAVASPATAVISLTVTEAAYCRAADGSVDVDLPEVAADLAALAAGEPCRTVPGRLVDGLRARRDAGSGPLAIVPCDNLTANGEVAARVVTSLAEVAADTGLAAWIGANVSFVSSMVDRITPATTDADRADAEALTGWRDECVVVAEPFAEWIVAGDFPAGRPAWENAGVRFVDDVAPFEQRKLWLLNGGHSLLAYLGLLRGHETIAEAMGDPVCVEALETLWSEAAAELSLPASEVDEARAALRTRFENPRIRHLLRQIAADGSHKIPVRVIDPLRRRLQRGAGVGPGQATALAAWLLHLRVQPSLVSDPRAPEASTSAVLAAVAPDLATLPDLTEAVDAAVDRLSADLGVPA